MTKRIQTTRLAACGLFAAGILLAMPTLRAQAPAEVRRAPATDAATPAQGEELDPLTCWWRTSTSAITVGQPFTLVLTCALVETETASAVVDRARLDPKAIELAPFEVLGGRVAPDVRAHDRTFFQVEYQLRFINEGFFNQDVTLPNVAVAYRLQVRGANQAAATQGMERRFAMPRQSLHVSSLVPGDANDIRDAVALTFADVDALDGRGRLLTTSGTVVMGLAAVLALAGVGRALGGRAPQAVVTPTLLSESAVLRGARAALMAVRKQVETTARWTAEDVTKAIAATRLVSDAAVGRNASQRLAAEGEPVLSGALAIRGRFGTGPTVIVSAAATPAGLSRLEPRTPRDRARVEALQSALATFTAAHYNEAVTLDDVALSQALSTVTDLAGRLSIERLRVVERLLPGAKRRPLERHA